MPEPSRRMKKMRRWGFYASAGFVAALIIASFAIQAIPQGGGQTSDERGSGEEIGEQYELLQAVHINRGEVYDGYNSLPPTSGPHWGATDDNPRDTGWAKCGIYDEELPDEQLVHNLEHSQVIISHNLPDQESIDTLKAIVRDLPGRRSWMIMRPYPQLNAGEIAISAWGWSDRFSGVDKDRIVDFYKAHMNIRGPERVSCLGASMD